MSQVQNLFKEYLNPVLVETGSAKGEGIELALEAGFKRIISIEAQREYYEFCKDKFKNNPEVEMVLGESNKVMGSIIDKIQSRITFWLDAHYCGDLPINGIQVLSFGVDKPNPLIEELKIIGLHPIKAHTILIDDLRLYGHLPLVEAIRLINNRYNIYYRDGTAVNDILIAEI